MSDIAPRRAPITTSVFVLICLALALLQEPGRFEFDRAAILSGELWRLWTAHLVHFSSAHLFWDVAIFLLVGTVAEKEFGTGNTLLLSMLGMPLLSMGLLLLTPDLVRYRGISGLATLSALASATALWERQPKLRATLLVLGLGLYAKTILDASAVGPTLTSLPQGVKVVWQAHLIGAVMGLVGARSRLLPALNRRPP